MEVKAIIWRAGYDTLLKETITREALEKALKEYSLPNNLQEEFRTTSSVGKVKEVHMEGDNVVATVEINELFSIRPGFVLQGDTLKLYSVSTTPHPHSLP